MPRLGRLGSRELHKNSGGSSVVGGWVLLWVLALILAASGAGSAAACPAAALWGVRHVLFMLICSLLIALTNLCLLAVGMYELSRFEERVHALHKGAEAADRRRQNKQDNGGGTAGGGGGGASSSAPLGRGSQLCAAQLAAKGVLALVGGDGGGDDAEATTLTGQRRRLYDAMEASLLQRGLALGGWAGGRAGGQAGKGVGQFVGVALLLPMLACVRPGSGMPADTCVCIAAPPPNHPAGAGGTQGMGLSDLFTRGEVGAGDEAGPLRPVLTALKVPVRAIVMPLTDPLASQ